MAVGQNARLEKVDIFIVGDGLLLQNQKCGAGNQQGAEQHQPGYEQSTLFRLFPPGHCLAYRIGQQIFHGDHQKNGDRQHGEQTERENLFPLIDQKRPVDAGFAPTVAMHVFITAGQNAQ